MLDDAITGISFTVTFDLDKHTLRHVDLKMAQHCPVVVQVMVERIALLQVAVQEIERHGVVSRIVRSEEHTSELQSLMRISYAVFCLKKKKYKKKYKIT